MDIVGLNAFFYDVYQYEDVIVAVKEKEKELFLPADEDDFGEFIMGIARISYSTMLWIFKELDLDRMVFNSYVLWEIHHQRLQEFEKSVEKI